MILIPQSLLNLKLSIQGMKKHLKILFKGHLNKLRIIIMIKFSLIKKFQKKDKKIWIRLPRKTCTDWKRIKGQLSW